MQKSESRTKQTLLAGVKRNIYFSLNKIFSKKSTLDSVKCDKQRVLGIQKKGMSFKLKVEEIKPQIFIST